MELFCTSDNFKRILSVHSLFLFVTISCFSQAFIKGKIINKSSAEVILYEPINDFCNNHLISKPSFNLRVNTEGMFEKRLQIHSPVVVMLMVAQNPVWVLLEPNDTINLEINTSKYDKFSPNGGISFTGKNAIGNTFYNNFNFLPIRKIIQFGNILDSLKFKETLNLESVDYALSYIVSPFDSLLALNKITRVFYDVIVNDTRGVLLTQLVKFAFFEKKLDLKIATKLVNQLYLKYPVTEASCKSGLYSSNIAYYYYYAKARQDFPNYILNDSVCTLNGKKIFVNGDFVPWLYAPKDLQEMQWAMSLLELKKLFSSVYGKRDREAYLTVYPSSKMKQYLVPPYFDTLEITETTAPGADFNIIQGDSIKTFSNLVSKFKGKKLFVDLWATWCVACKLEFSSNYMVDTFCKANQIDRLYIAFEIASTKTNFKRDIYSYKLRGNHVLASDSLIQDIIRRFYPGEQSYNIPRYILINENGEVVNAEASRPSSGNELFSEMRAAFKIQN
jgi:thiol-disulfide isomerase/thioredoxin